VTRIGVLARLSEAPEQLFLTADRTYVLASYQTLTTVMPGNTDLQGSMAQLKDMRSKALIIENIALSRASVDQR